MNIYTLTLSPAFDIHCNINNLNSGKENTVYFISKEPAGKGINISRALSNNGINNKSIGVLGKDNSDEFKTKLAKHKINFIEIQTDGTIRENITLHHPDNSETRLSFDAFPIDNKTYSKCEELLLNSLKPNDILTITGRLPKGIDISRIKTLISKLTTSDIFVVIDSKSFSLNDLSELKPFLIKPNEEEISEYLNKDVTDFDSITKQADLLYKKGIKNVMISLGAKGSLLVCDEGMFIASPPKISVVSTIGAGDSTIAGFLAAFTQGKNRKQCLATAVAYGTAACLTEGTNPPEPEVIKRISDNIITEHLK